MSKFRKFSLVIHNVNPQEDQYWSKVIGTLSAKKAVHSIEPYPEHPDHYHIHIFVEFANPRSFHQILHLFEQFKNNHILPAPDKTKTPGRVQCDPMRGSFEEATAYLTEGQSKKDKLFGVPKTVNKNCSKCDFCQNITPNLFIHKRDGFTMCSRCNNVLYNISWFDTRIEYTRVHSLDLMRQFSELFSQGNTNGLDSLNVSQEIPDAYLGFQEASFL